jgi:hypothetical protein
MTAFARGVREEDDRPRHLESFACFLRRTGGFHPMTTSALHGASVSFAIKKNSQGRNLGRTRTSSRRESIGSRQIRAAP